MLGYYRDSAFRACPACGSPNVMLTASREGHSYLCLERDCKSRLASPQLTRLSPVLQSGFVTCRVGGRGARSAGLTEGDGHLTIMVCENCERRGGRRGHGR